MLVAECLVYRRSEMAAQGEPPFASRCTGGDKKKEVRKDFALVVDAIDIGDASGKGGERTKDEQVGIGIGNGIGNDILKDGGQVVPDGACERRKRGFCSFRSFRNFADFRSFRNLFFCGNGEFGGKLFMVNCCFSSCCVGFWVDYAVLFRYEKERTDGDSVAFVGKTAGILLSCGCFIIFRIEAAEAKEIGFTFAP